MSMLKLAAAGLALAFATTALAQSKAPAKGPDLGQPASAQDIAKWDIDVAPSGKGLPAGSGTVQRISGPGPGSGAKKR